MPDEIRRDDLMRSAQFSVRAIDDESGDGFTIDGYAAVYDTPTRIDSWEGQFDEEIAFGAFGRSIRAKLPKLQFDHGQHPLLGSLPLGRWESVTEEKEGLHTIGRLYDNWLVEPFRQAIADQAVDGMSFRFSVVREDWFDSAGKKLKLEEVGRLLYEPNDRGPLRRVLRELKISEAGPVVWPAYQETSVGMRSKVTIDLANLTDPDQRNTLARAVFLADAANSKEESDGPQVTEGTPDEHVNPEEEARQAAEVESKIINEATRKINGMLNPPVTAPATDEHPSPARGHRPIDLWVRKARDIVLTIDREAVK